MYSQSLFLKVTGEVKEGDSKDKLGNVKSGKGYLEIFFVPFIHVFGTSIYCCLKTWRMKLIGGGSGSKFDQLIYGLNNFCLGKVNYIFFVMMSDAGVDEKQDNSPILNTTKSSP